MFIFHEMCQKVYHEHFSVVYTINYREIRYSWNFLKEIFDSVSSPLCTAYVKFQKHKYFEHKSPCRTLSNPLCTWPHLRRCLRTHERMNEHSRLCSKFHWKSKSESHFLLFLHHLILRFYYPLSSTHSHWFHCFDYCCRLDIITSCLSTQSVRYCKILNQKWCQSRN